MLERIRVYGEVAFEAGSLVEYFAYAAVVVLAQRLELLGVLDLDLGLSLCNTVVVLGDKLPLGRHQSFGLLDWKCCVSVELAVAGTETCYQGVTLSDELGCVVGDSLFLSFVSFN